MRYILLLHYREPEQAEIDPEAWADAERAFDAYGAALQAAGVMIAAEVLQPSLASTSVSAASGELRVEDGPYIDTKEKLAGIFVIDVTDLDAALEWAKRAPSVAWGGVEVRPVATSWAGDRWTAQQ